VNKGPPQCGPESSKACPGEKEKKRKENLGSIDGTHFHSHLIFLQVKLEFHQIHHSQCITLV
jgi:hypothetical protein